MKVMKIGVLLTVVAAAVLCPVAALAGPAGVAASGTTPYGVGMDVLPAPLTSPPTCSTAAPDDGLSWGQRNKTALPNVGSSLVGTVTEDDGTITPTGLGTTGLYSDVIGRVGVQDHQAIGPQIQVGIREQNGQGAFFMVEEQDATNPPTGSDWFTIAGSPTYYEHWSAAGSATIDTAYAFSIKRTAANSYQATVPGYTSPVFNFPAGSDPIDISTYVNETRANSSTCPESNFNFTNPSPFTFNNVPYNGGTGSNGGLFTQTLITNTDWFVGFPLDSSCQPPAC
jgi:hypothetical protein